MPDNAHTVLAGRRRLSQDEVAAKLARAKKADEDYAAWREKDARRRRLIDIITWLPFPPWPL